MKDHLAMLSVEPQDKLDYGVIGMKWGVSRSAVQLRTAATKRGAGGKTETPTTKTEGPETSQTRYTRLQAQAKAGKSGDMNDVDLKFFNARTEALGKIAKLNEQKPGWLSETAKKVVRTTAERQLQTVSDAVANKYISDRITAQLKKAAEKK